MPLSSSATEGEVKKKADLTVEGFEDKDGDGDDLIDDAEIVDEDPPVKE